jgi:hypothetical protein
MQDHRQELKSLHVIEGVVEDKLYLAVYLESEATHAVDKKVHSEL